MGSGSRNRRVFFAVVMLFCLGPVLTFADNLAPPPIILPGPVITAIHITSSNASSTLGKPDDNVTLSFTSNQGSSATPTATIGGHAATTTSAGGNSWTAIVTMVSGDSEGTIAFTADVLGPVGIAHTSFAGTSDGSSVIFDATPPIISAASDVATTATGPATPVTYSTPQGSDTRDGIVTVSCTPASGSSFSVGDTTVNCIASDAAGNAAIPVSFVVRVSGVVPTANPVAGTYTSAQSVTLSADGASSIRYTTDGSTPSCEGDGTGTIFSSPIDVESSLTIQAVSCYSDGISSPLASFAYIITIPAPTPEPTPPVSNGGGGGGGNGPIVDSLAPSVPDTPPAPSGEDTGNTTDIVVTPNTGNIAATSVDTSVAAPSPRSEGRVAGASTSTAPDSASTDATDTASDFSTGGFDWWLLLLLLLFLLADGWWVLNSKKFPQHS